MIESGVCRARRREIEGSTDARFVETDEFLDLLVSWRKMDRSDDSIGKVRGLLDLQTGKRFLIEQEKLAMR
jgi:hypothetical protein